MNSNNKHTQCHCAQLVHQSQLNGSGDQFAVSRGGNKNRLTVS